MDTADAPAPRISSLESSAQVGVVSPVPQLGDGFQDTNATIESDYADDSNEEANKDSEKSAIRKLFRFGKKKDNKGKAKNKAGLELQENNTTSDRARAELSRSPPLQTTSPSHPNHPYQFQTSPTRNLHSSSSRRVSPAGSQIFERDVQESALPLPNSPAIPSHIQTEDHIPSVLDASSEAITNTKLDPDSVEIVMHSAHQPAAVPATGFGSDESMTSLADDFAIQPEKEDAASNYTGLGGPDVRRLSFISFADVVQSEHAEHTGSRDNTHITGFNSLSAGHRSPSPMRSPISSQGFGNSSPTSNPASVKGVELSSIYAGRPLGSPSTSISSIANQPVGELTIETMSAALKKSGNGNLGGTKS